HFLGVERDKSTFGSAHEMTMHTTSPAPVLPPPPVAVGLLGWLRTNLFSPWYNAVLTVVAVGVLARVAGPVWRWVFTLAHWQAVTVNLRLFIVGLYPGDQLWRPGLVLILLAWLLGGSAAHQKGMVRSVSSTLLVGFVLLTLVLTASARLLVGGAALALL